jgi:hypothetical protein
MIISYKKFIWSSFSTHVFSVVRVTQFLVFCVVFCRSLFVLFLLAIVLSVLRFTDSDNSFGIFYLFLPRRPVALCQSHLTTPWHQHLLSLSVIVTSKCDIGQNDVSICRMSSPVFSFLARTSEKTGVLRKGKQFLLHWWHPSCYSC